MSSDIADAIIAALRLNTLKYSYLNPRGKLEDYGNETYLKSEKPRCSPKLAADQVFPVQYHYTRRKIIINTNLARIVLEFFTTPLLCLTRAE